MREQKGITMVALIVTIIVMLILAGISISWVVGEDGIISKAEKAELKSNIAQAAEKAELIKASVALDVKTGEEDKLLVVQEFKERLNKELNGKIEGNKIVVDDQYSIIIKNTDLDFEVVEGNIPDFHSLLTMDYKIEDKEVNIKLLSTTNDINKIGEYYQNITTIDEKEKEILKFECVNSLDEVVIKKLEENFNVVHPEYKTLDDWAEDKDVKLFATSQGITGPLTRDTFYMFLFGTVDKNKIIEKAFSQMLTDMDYGLKSSNTLVKIIKDGKIIYQSFNSAGTSIDISENGEYELWVGAKTSNAFVEFAFEKVIVNR